MTRPSGAVLARSARRHRDSRPSDRQWRDILGLIKAQHATLDLVELRNNARRAELVELLERALNAAGIDEVAQLPATDVEPKERRSLTIDELRRLLEVADGAIGVLVDLCGRNGLLPAESRAPDHSKSNASPR